MNGRQLVRATSRTRILEELVTDLAARQHGVVSRRQLLDLGLSRTMVQSRLDTGRIRALFAGVYLVGPVEPKRAREMAAVLAGGPHATLSHTSALGLWNLFPAEPDTPIHISVPFGGRFRRVGIVFHRVQPLAPDERVSVDGIPVTSPIRTIVDVAGMLGSRELELVVAAAERSGLIGDGDLPALPERYARRPGMAMLRKFVRDRANLEFTRSEAERRCLSLLLEAGLPRPRTNFRLGPYEIDLFWPEERVAVEIDGWAFHGTRSQFEGDRRKDAWLCARGIEVIRLSWRQITRHSTATAVQIGQALALARARCRAPRASDDTAGPGRPRHLVGPKR